MARAKSIIDLFKAVTKTSPKKKSVQKELRKKELKDRVQKPTEEDPRKKAVRNKQQSVVKAAQRRAKTADRSKKDQKVAARVLPAVSGVRNKVEGMSVTDLGNKFTGPELKSMEMKLKQATNPNKTLLNKLKEARDYRIGMVESTDSPSAYPSKTPSKFRKSGGVVKRKGGGKIYERKHGGKTVSGNDGNSIVAGCYD